MNLFKKIERGLTVLALSPFIGLEKHQRDRKLEERLKNLERKHKVACTN